MLVKEATHRICRHFHISVSYLPVLIQRIISLFDTIPSQDDSPSFRRLAIDHPKEFFHVVIRNRIVG